MCIKGRIRHKACLHSSACNLPCSARFVDVDRRRQQAKLVLKPQRYRGTHGEQRQAADTSRRCLSHQRENDSCHSRFVCIMTYISMVCPTSPTPIRVICRGLTTYTIDRTNNKGH